MNQIINNINDPYYNLALEELLLQAYDEIIMFWRNSPTVVVGRNQNTLEEIDCSVAESEGINIVRRESGGGAVYHDLGNINYTVITHAKHYGDFEHLARPILGYLDSLGVEASCGGRNDIIAHGKKISGSAQRVSGSKLLHHGTLLVSSDLNELSRVLRPNPLKLTSKGINSVRARVVNLSELYDIEVDRVYKGLQNTFPSLDIDPSITQRAEQLAVSKYRSWQWNYGNSPKFSCNYTVACSAGIVTLALNIVEGIIEEIRLSGDFFNLQPLELLYARVLGNQYTTSFLATLASELPQYIANFTHDNARQLLQQA